jgi:hypothetical protein
MRWGSLGACVAMGLALAVQAGYFITQNRAIVGPAFRRWTLVVGVGLLFAPLAWLRASAPANVALYCGAAGGYLLILRALGVISARELRAVFHALGIGRTERARGGETGS